MIPGWARRWRFCDYCCRAGDVLGRLGNGLDSWSWGFVWGNCLRSLPLMIRSQSLITRCKRDGPNGPSVCAADHLRYEVAPLIAPCRARRPLGVTNSHGQPRGLRVEAGSGGRAYRKGRQRREISVELNWSKSRRRQTPDREHAGGVESPFRSNSEWVDFHVRRAGAGRSPCGGLR
jgi:hypothetical protein